MPSIYFHMHDPHEPRVIDITPMPWWRRSARALLALLVFLVAVPLLWLTGAVLGLVVIIGIGAAMLGLAAARAGAPRRSDREKSEPPRAP